MRQFVAMLRDSYKEAVDGWIFFVMLALAGVVIALVGSLSVTPLPPAEAVPKAVNEQTLTVVSAGRGTATRTALFLFRTTLSEVQAVPRGDHPWEADVRFTLECQSAGFGPAGVEVDDAKKPKDVKKIEAGGLFTDAFREAVRYWAWSGLPGDPKPEYTDDLATAFVADQVRSSARLNVTSVEKAPGAGNKFVVAAAGADRIGWVHRGGLFFGAWEPKALTGPLGDLIYLVENGLVNQVGAWALLLVGVVISAGFVPNMLRKGAIDLLLTKPMSRPAILLYKYFGGLTFVFLLTAVTVAGVWLVIGLKAGVWSAGLLFCVLGVTGYFAILYAMSTLVGVLTRNAIVCIVVTVAFWGVLYLVGLAYNFATALDALEIQQQQVAPPPRSPDGKPKAEANPDDSAVEGGKLEKPVAVPPWLLSTLKVLNTALPRTNDLDKLTKVLIGRDLLSPRELHQNQLKSNDVAWDEVGGVAGGWIAFFLGLAMLRFVTRSY